MSNRKPPEEGKGVLFSNDKRGNEKAPDFRGEVMVRGEIFRFSGWKRVSAYGELISLMYNPPLKEQPRYPKEVEVKDSEIPF